MAGLWRNDSETREGKYPVVLRRDGTVPEWEWFVLGARDPAAIAALLAYADTAKLLGWDPQYVTDLYTLAEKWRIEQHQEHMEKVLDRQAARYADDPRNQRFSEPSKPSNPDGSRHRIDDPDALQFPMSLGAYRAKIKSASTEK